ncbi:acid phosphatase AphA [Rhodocollybia butyracea]|uniref:Purple acid phosphatase n=1 Tax=Rhodocollybia butyracea TaxID=206335 RepID=A0A9P5U588_9AGAR|nr:acid phosphatase AphA [Rhodocollybia butyracea]
MKNFALLAILVASVGFVVGAPRPDVDTAFPYTGPAVPIADWVDQTINGNGKGFPRLTKPPAVEPKSKRPTNNINVITTSYIPSGINIHFQTPFGIGRSAPEVKFGRSAHELNQKAVGTTHTYDRTPPCALVSVTQCSQFFHEVQLKNLHPDTEYFYQIPGGNGTTESQVLSFRTALSPGQHGQFTVAIINDMGFTNAKGTHKFLTAGAESGEFSFAWHGGDISYADDWYSGILPCESDWPVCYNGTSSELPTPDGTIDNPDYLIPLPKGEIADQGGPLGGDISVVYESNWDLWSQFMMPIFSKIPYMVNPGNHEASCAEFDGPNNELTALLNEDILNGTAPKSELTYYSCPPSQRNFTAYQHRFRMPGEESGGVSNFWYSGLAHFVSFDGETDYVNSPEFPFVADLSGNETHPQENETFPTDSGPFGYINGSFRMNLAAVDRAKTPFVFAMSHRPMYSTGTASYQTHMRTAFEDLFLEAGVDAYLSGHIHWYERLKPLGRNGTIDTSAIVNENTYKTNKNVSMVHIVNGQAGNIESHSTLDGEQILNITAVLNTVNYGFTKLTVFNSTTAKFEFVAASNGSIIDTVHLIKGR